MTHHSGDLSDDRFGNDDGENRAVLLHPSEALGDLEVLLGTERTIKETTGDDGRPTTAGN